ncbi:Metallo-dependent phosphatase [Cytidiella melzeri]|nr:Metallo-dependent phosphatase [Cytidiella melzeri]
MALPTSESATSRVYTSYDVAHPPPHPGSAWTRFVCISDTHSVIYKVPPGDVLLHAGDLSSWGECRQLDKTLKWLHGLRHPTKIIIAGNHDLCLDKEWTEGGATAKDAGGGLPLKEYTSARERLQKYKTLHYLEYQSYRFTTEAGRTWEVYGSPAVRRYRLGAFQYVGRDEAKSIYARIPPSTEILLTHTPPHGTCDMTKRGVNAGCLTLAEQLSSDDLCHVKLHVFGHIHEAHGAVMTSPDMPNERVNVNAAMPSSDNAVIVDLLN